MPRTLLIDTDTASDDAVAIIMALRAPDVRVAAITPVAGNVPVHQSTRNALYTAELCQAEVPVYTGAARPLLRPHQNATWFHGQDGLGDHNYPAPRRAAENLHAADAIIQTIEANPGLTIVTLAPLTNLALALSKKPQIAEKVGRFVLMGGAPCCEGNVTPAAEYNIWVDPEAARIVMLSGMPIELVGWHLSRGEAVISANDVNKILSLNNKIARFAIECNSHAREAYKIQTGEDGISLPDPIAMCIALNPDVVTEASDHFVEIETQSELTRGMTIVDRLNVSADDRNRAQWLQVSTTQKKVQVDWTIDNNRWKQALFAALR